MNIQHQKKVLMNNLIYYKGQLAISLNKIGYIAISETYLHHIDFFFRDSSEVSWSFDTRKERDDIYNAILKQTGTEIIIDSGAVPDQDYLNSLETVTRYPMPPLQAQYIVNLPEIKEKGLAPDSPLLWALLPDWVYFITKNAGDDGDVWVFSEQPYFDNPKWHMDGGYAELFNVIAISDWPKDYERRIFKRPEGF